MKTRLERYFGKDVKKDARMFYLASFMSAFFALLFDMVGIIIRYNSTVLWFLALCCVYCSYLFFAEFRNPRTTFHILCLLIGANLFGFPFCLLLSGKNSAEIVVYYFIGITYGMVLLKGKQRALYMVGQGLIDMITMYYVFVLRTPYETYYAALDSSDYLRIVFAIVATGVICGAMILYRDHLIRNEIEESKEAGKEAEQINYAKDMFLVNVSHEIRTPLNAIIGTTDVLMDSDVSNHIREMASNISNSGHALLSITSDLLDFSRMNEDAIHPVDEKYDISVMLKDVINMFNVRLLDSKVHFYVDINPFLPKMLIGDSGKIRQILVNLLSNGVKYTKEGHMTLHVWFDYEGRDCVRIHVDVEDTGIGIKPENLDKIFEAYNRSGNATTDREIEGNGLGLALCKRLSAAMGGSLWVESEYKKGSTFHFEVLQELETPYLGGYCGGLKYDRNRITYYCAGNSDTMEIGNVLASMDIENRKAESREEFIEECREGSADYFLLGSESYDGMKASLNEAGINWSKLVIVSDCNYSYSGEPFEYVLTKPVSCLNMADLLNHAANYAYRKHQYEGKFTIPDATILLVDDNLVNLEVASSLLSRYKAKILTAASGKEGLICLGQEKVDIVFLDYMMPDMDGIDTLKEIRKLPDERYKDLPVIVLTANVVSGAKEMFMNAGFDAYLSKPIETERIEKALLEFLPGQYFKYEI